MRFWSWPRGPPSLPTVLVLLLGVLVRAEARERRYYIGAVEIDWTYSSDGSPRSGPTYKKVVFREFEEGFQQQKTHPPWLGLLGPTLRATKGDTIVVTFRNMAKGPLSIHSHGVAYGKQSEGAHYFDNTSQKEKEDDIVQPNNEHVYYWEVTSDVSPLPDDPTCLTYTYVSHQNVVEDYNSGLIGTLLICKPGSLDADDKQIGIPYEYVFLFGVFDEKESKYKPKDDDVDNHVKYTINGYTRGSLPDISVCAYATVSLHLMAMSSQPEVFSLHVNGQVLQQNGHKVSSLGLISGSTATTSMVAVHPGRWLLSSHTSTHIQAGMHGFVEVKMCDSFRPPQRRLTIAQRRESREWKYFIAAEEITWDYAPKLQEYTDEDFKDQYLKQSPTRIGQRYKKAVYTLYKNEAFTERLWSKQRKNELGILGPVIRAQIRDVITIVFKNMASRPYSIYPHGLTIQKSEEGVNYPEGGNQTHGVPPGETHTYVWKVVEEDEPLPGDQRCLTRMYHSAVDTPRDIASGLIGPLLICKSHSLNARNVQLRADKEQHAVFAVFDENKSWYLQDNINQFSDPTKVNPVDPNFYKSNVMHTINGYTFESGPLLGFCNGEVATWHVSSVGAQDYIQTATFYGHPFELNERTEDFLSLYPMTGETISMNMDNIGVWLLASLNSHETTKGMRVKFQDVECYRDYEYDYSKEEPEGFNMWDIPDLDAIKKEEATPKPEKAKTKSNLDDDTAMWALELGLRSLSNQSSYSDVELLDLSLLYDDDIPDGDSNITLVDEVTKTKNKTIPLETVVSNLDKLDEVNLTVVNNGSNSTHIEKKSTTPVETNSSIPKTENTTDFISQASLHNNNNKTMNCCDFQVRSKRDKVLSDNTSETNTSAVHNATEISYALNRSSEMANDTEPLREPLLLKFVKFVLSTLEALQMPIEVFSFNETQEQEQEKSENETFHDSSLENDVGNIKAGNLTNISLENITGLSGDLTLTDNVSVSSSSESSQELSASESSEEVFIFLKENKTQVIKTTAVKTPGHNWTYDGTHQKVDIEIPDHMVKYFKPDATQTTAAPTKKTKTRVTRRQKPAKGEGMKTRKKKVYKPVARSGLPFSPRGFPPGMTPRGARPNIPQPVSDEEQLINEPVVVGIPRPDFSDYELYIPGDEPDHQGLDEKGLKENEYEYVTYKDPYSNEDILNFNRDDTTKYHLKFVGPNVNTYFISAEEVEWDYTGYGLKRSEKTQQNTQKTTFTKVVFRGYTDSSFTVPDIRGEVEEHLGILGPIIKAEVGQSIMVVFRNNANRPYSIHPNGVTYTKQTEGLSYEDGSKYWYKFDNEVQPNSTFTYLWKVDSRVGPSEHESDCRTWAYYSGVNPERDIHTGLIGPLLVCREGTMSKNSPNENEFVLLFMTFDESQSWYYQENMEMMQRKSRRRMMMQPQTNEMKFHSINGIIFNLKGLRMYTGQLVRWHLINMGSPKDFQSVYFHGQTFVHKKTTGYRQAVFPLLPGTFATLEMYLSKPGLWQLETEVGFNQQRGMQTLFLVVDQECFRPLGLESGSVKNNQITADNTRGYWEPHLARLNGEGKYNAWSTEQNGSWIQVDFQRPVVITQVATQGAKQMFHSQYVKKYLISYRRDRRKWIFYKGGTRDLRKVFTGNTGAYETKKNTFFPPVIGRFIRLHPIDWYGMATLRMEFYGCELDGCSVPLGMESGHIENRHITSSSRASYWYAGPWEPSLARLNRQGAVNAWQAQRNDLKQWLQVELPHVKKITGIITQGAKSMGTEMYVMSYALQYSDNGIRWFDYTDDEDSLYKVFPGNTNNNDHVKNYIYPPIFSRFIRILPKTWVNSITMRVELLGCDFE